MLDRRLVADVDALQREGPAQVAEVADALPAHTVEIDGVARFLQLADSPARFLDQVGVESAGESAVGCQQDDRRALRPALGGRCRPAQERELVRQLRRHQVRDHRLQRLGVGPRRHDAILRALELRRGRPAPSSW